MKKWMCAAVASLCATTATAQERHFVCISDRDGGETRLDLVAEGDKGRIATAQIEGDATVFKGVGNMTFMLIDGQDVMTFVVQLDDLSYDLSVKGPQAGNDYGACTETEA